MLHLKQTLHNVYTTISTNISTIKQDLQSRGLVPQNLVLAENLGILLYCLLSLVSIVLLTAVTFISSLLSLIVVTSKKLKELWRLTETPGFNVQYIVGRWADAVKNTISTLKKSQKSAWKKDGGLRPDYTYPYSEMRGGLENAFDPDEFEKEQQARAKVNVDDAFVERVRRHM